MIRLQGIRRQFKVGDQVVKALDEVSLEIGAGDYVSIMGPSGSGKSTLLHVIGLLDRPDAGNYSLAGRDVTSLSDSTVAASVTNEIATDSGPALFGALGASIGGVVARNRISGSTKGK